MRRCVARDVDVGGWNTAMAGQGTSPLCWGALPTPTLHSAMGPSRHSQEKRVGGAEIPASHTASEGRGSPRSSPSCGQRKWEESMVGQKMEEKVDTVVAEGKAAHERRPLVCPPASHADRKVAFLGGSGDLFYFFWCGSPLAVRDVFVFFAPCRVFYVSWWPPHPFRRRRNRSPSRWSPYY